MTALSNFPLPMSAPVASAITATTSGSAISSPMRIRPADIAIRTVGAAVTVTPVSAVRFWR